MYKVSRRMLLHPQASSPLMDPKPAVCREEWQHLCREEAFFRLETTQGDQGMHCHHVSSHQLTGSKKHGGSPSLGDDIVEKKKALPKGWGNRKTLNDHLRNRSFDLEQVVSTVKYEDTQLDVLAPLIKVKAIHLGRTVHKSREHTNLVALVGFCDKKSSEIIFVYVYVASGDLVDKMRKHLNAIQRLEICLEPNETIVEACPIEDDNGVTVESNVPENEPEGAINILRTASKTTTISLQSRENEALASCIKRTNLLNRLRDVRPCKGQIL
ncbi:tyrosine-protein kinase, non-receptor Jak2 [Tanacetum coccineum]